MLVGPQNQSFGGKFENNCSAAFSLRIWSKTCTLYECRTHINQYMDMYNTEKSVKIAVLEACVNQQRDKLYLFTWLCKVSISLSLFSAASCFSLTFTNSSSFANISSSCLLTCNKGLTCRESISGERGYMHALVWLLKPCVGQSVL